jgi:ferritin-like metal-binding protein YciE
MKTKTRRSSGGQSRKSEPMHDGNGLHELFEMELKDIYWAEKALTKAIPKMIKKATSEELVGALEEHLAVTENQVKRVEQVFELMDMTPKAKKCEAMDGIIKEGEEIMKETEEGMARDAGIISAAQKVEHYEIASYGTLCAFAKTLGMTKGAELLEETLNEEKEADATLSKIAESSINEEAMQEESGMTT